MINRDQLSAEAQAILQAGSQEAQSRGNTSFGTEHLLLGLLADGRSLPSTILRDHISYDEVVLAVDRVFKSDTELENAPDYTPRLKKVLELALESSVQLGSKEIQPVHLALGLLRLDRDKQQPEGVAGLILSGAGVSREEVEEELLDAAQQSQ